jgi:hypothetical protein
MVAMGICKTFLPQRTQRTQKEHLPKTAEGGRSVAQDDRAGAGTQCEKALRGKAGPAVFLELFHFS